MTRLLLAALVLAFVFFAPAPASAIGAVSGVPSTCTGYPPYPLPSPDTGAGCLTAQEWCDARMAAIVAFYPPNASYSPYAVVTGSGSGTSCLFKSTMAADWTWSSTTLGAPGTRLGTPVCPPNSTGSAGSCVCNVGFRPPDQTTTGTTCEAHTCPPPKGLGTSTFDNLTAPSARGQLYLCDDARGNLNNNPQYGCGITATRDMSATGADGKITEWWVQSTSTNVCNGNGTGATPDEPKSESTQPEPNPTPSAKGTCPGTISGTPTCQACSSTTGSQTTTTGTGAGAPGTTTTKDIACTGNTCVTTETTKDASGTVTSVTQSTSSKTTTCAANAGNPACGGSGSGTGGEGEDEDPSTFGGSCAGGFTCEGDAVQCAIARDQHIRHCTMFDLVTAEVTAGLGYINESSAENYQPDGHPGKTPTEVNIGTMFASGMVVNPWGSSCPGDQVIAGITLPLSQACGSLQLLGSIAVALTILMCAGWLVTRGV